MLQHSLKHGAIDHLYSSCSFVFADLVEGGSVRVAELAVIRHEEWGPYRNTDTAKCLCKSRFLARKSSPRWRICLFLFGSLSALAGFHAPGEIVALKRGLTTESVATR